MRTKISDIKISDQHDFDEICKINQNLDYLLSDLKMFKLVYIFQNEFDKTIPTIKRSQKIVFNKQKMGRILELLQVGKKHKT